ncbi:hypothetical protein PSTG_03008 [Puccinia striiformis f. sp. tritici PST-78]|uniref:Uncharacterized protein n=1 Tax=Puccinia striiformis f. sp. tritici PST-78 TaxID=1165861 RepID=A0A0L0VXC9_9BASI|nr:hypothetical protein PSTG_03008 [Puccinia striiformis f. sp. tritici PST-78]
MAVLWLRKKANKLHFFRVNKLGLIHVEVLNEIVVLMLVFSVSNYLISFFFFPIISIKITGSESELVAVIDLVTQEFVEQGSLVFSKKLILRTCKFPIAANVCWCMFIICLIINAASGLKTDSSYLNDGK